MKRYRSFYVPISFLILSLLMIQISDVSLNFVSDQLLARFIRNGIFVMALIIPIMSGMGINFAISIGAIAAQISMIIVVDLKLPGDQALFVALLLSLFFLSCIWKHYWDFA